LSKLIRTNVKMEKAWRFFGLGIFRDFRKEGQRRKIPSPNIQSEGGKRKGPRREIPKREKKTDSRNGGKERKRPLRYYKRSCL